MARDRIFSLALAFTCLVLIFSKEVLGAKHKITIFEKPNYEGDAMTLTKKYNDISKMTGLRSILNATGSYCAIGVWTFHDLPNYGDKEKIGQGYNTPTEECNNLHRSLGFAQSIRYMGPEDFDRTAIAFYEGGLFVTSGGEAVVTGQAGNKFGFAPQNAYFFGNASWTLFSGNDFNGDSTCVSSNSVDGVFAGLQNFGKMFAPLSVVKGCHPEEVEENIKLFRQGIIS